MSGGAGGEWVRFEERAQQLEGLRATNFHRSVTAALDRLLSAAPPGTALEVGCGPGALLMAWGKRGRPACGLDGARAMARLAHANSGCPVVLADAARLPFASKSLALVAGMFHFQLMPDPRGALEESRRVLVPGGWIGLAVQHPQWTEEQARRLAHETEESPEAEEWLAACARRSRRSTRYTEAELSSLLVSAGFDRVRILAWPPGTVILAVAVNPAP